MGMFYPETLSRQWNRIIPIMTEEQKKDAKFKAAYEKEQADRRRTDELVKFPYGLIIWKQ
jgi:hypothetical protein